MKRVYSFTALFLSLCLLLSSITVVEAGQGNFGVTEQGIRVQYVPVGNGENCYSQTAEIYDGQQVEVALLIQMDANESTIMSNHLMNATLLDSAWGDFMISMKDTKVVTSDGEEILLSELDGWYMVKEENAKEGTTFASMNLDSYTAGDLNNGYLYATITVYFVETGDAGNESDKLQGLADVEGTLPDECFYEVEDNVIELIDFTLDGTLTIHGNETYDTVILVIRGDCDITNLVVDCPVTIRRYAYASLCGTAYMSSGDNTITFDTGYNRSVLLADENSYSIVFDDSIDEGEMTQGERDELNDTYNYSWRSRKSEWYQKALADINSLRKQEVQVNITDESGAQITDAEVRFNLEDYDYYLGCASSSAGLDANNNWEFYHNLTLKENISINYDEFAWENYDTTYEGDENHTYSFEYVSLGNTNYHRDRARFLQENGVTVIAQPLIYPSIYAMSDLYNRENLTVPNELKAYIFSDEYTPEGFNQKVKDHIAEEITSYAGYIYVWALVNEEYYYNEFFQMIYGVDDETNEIVAGNGLTKDHIKKILLSMDILDDASNDEKMEALRTYLKGRDLIPAEEAAKIVCSWADVAQEAWDATIVEDCGYTSDDLILYCNDACWKGDTSQNEENHYTYYLDYATALSNPKNYARGEVLVEMMGLQMASSTYRSNPMEVIEMLDDMKSIGKQLLVTEANYWVDNPYTDTGVDNSNYGYGPEKYLTSNILSQAEKEFAYDYGYYMMTALYSHSASDGIFWAGYPSGQIGCRYQGGDINVITPIGEAYYDLTIKEWNSSERLTSDSTKVTLTRGTYLVTIEKDGKVYRKEMTVDKNTDTLNIVLDEPFINQNECLVAAIYEDENYTIKKEHLGTFESIEDVNASVDGKTGYLFIRLKEDCVISEFPAADGILGIKIVSDDGQGYTLSLDAEEIELNADVSLLTDVNIKKDLCHIQGNDFKILMMNMTLDGGELTSDNLDMIFAEDVHINAPITGVDELYIDWNLSLTQNDGNVEWQNKYAYTNVFINAPVCDVKEMHIYGGKLIVSEVGSLEVEEISGVYGDIYLKKTGNDLADVTVTKTMTDMIWQIRLHPYSEPAEDWWNVEYALIEDGTVIAYLSENADSSCTEKLGIIMQRDESGNDSWDDYGTKEVKNNRMFYGAALKCLHVKQKVCNKKEVTCTDDGYTGDTYCIDCESLLEEGSDIPSVGSHTYEKGICSVCGAVQKQQEGFGFGFRTLSKTYGDASFTVSATGAVQGSVITYESDNSSVATIDNTGKVTILKAGSATITATASEAGDYAKATATFSLSVSKSAVTPNMPSQTMTVANSITTVSQIVLPANWKWSDNDAGKTLSEGVAVTATANYDGTDKGSYVTESVAITITREKSIISYSIKYNGNGATSGSMSIQENRKYGTTYRLATNKFKRTGYTFAGWNTKKDGKGKAYTNEASVKNLTDTNGATVTLYAQWKVNKYSINYSGNGATSGSMSVQKNRKYGTTYRLATNKFKRTGYTFVGWNTKKNGKGKAYANKAKVKNLTASNGKKITLYAQWKKTTYKITYKLNGGKNNPKNPKTFTVTTKTITLKKPSRSGYTFGGWYKDSKFTKKVTKIPKGSTKNVTLYAKWIKKG